MRKKLPKAIVTFNVQDIFPYNLAFSGRLKRNSIVFRILAAEQRYGYKHSDHVITISEDMKDTLVADDVDPDKVEVIYNWSYQDEYIRER
jgi:glycosyltransferase involved in cell wall biosynthesis